ncbi:MAG: hypothetical protein HY719_05115, partial [Planctomycetes bacterium]|nr:hypothetical protein [Planctomycetota bacterium]
PAALIDRLLAELDRLRAGGLDAAVFERKKRRALGDFVRVFNSPSGSVHAMMNAWLKKYDLLDHLRLLNETTLDQLHQRLATHLLPAEMATLTISPRRQTRPRRTRRAATSRRR